jgi:hypothetical protein
MFYIYWIFADKISRVLYNSISFEPHKWKLDGHLGYLKSDSFDLKFDGGMIDKWECYKTKYQPNFFGRRLLDRALVKWRLNDMRNKA